jgi:hypothetical protein
MLRFASGVGTARARGVGGVGGNNHARLREISSQNRPTSLISIKQTSNPCKPIPLAALL